MSDRASSSRTFKSQSAVSLEDLEHGIRGWLFDCDVRQHSKRTLEARRSLTDKLLWWLAWKLLSECGPNEIRGFLAYCARGHEQQGGRWALSPNNGGKFRPLTRAERPVSPRTIQTYFGHLRTLFAWIADDQGLAESPMASLTPPIVRRNQIQPFSEDQVVALLEAARKSPQRHRDSALIHFLLDTGVRASELCMLTMKDLDIEGKRCTVRGKGNKTRVVYFGRKATHTLWMYLRHEKRRPEEPVFTAEGGLRRHQALTPNGLFQIVRRLGGNAGLQADRCSPHTCRHTFAIAFLRAGGNVFALQQLLGHESLTICQVYVKLAQADIENQHRASSPLDNLLPRRQ